MFLDADDFANIPYDLPAEDLENPTFLEFVDTEERNILSRYMLGSELYDEFNEAVLAGGTLDAKWQNLIDSATYMIGAKTFRKKSLVDILVPACHSRWIKDTFIIHTAAGHSVPRQENANMVHPEFKIVRSWNDFHYLCGNYQNIFDTFYGFMRTNLETYPTWRFKDPGRLNRFNL